MTFKRINPPGQPQKDVPASHLGIGIRASMQQDVKGARFYMYSEKDEYSDIELLRYAASEGREQYVDFLLSNGGFFDDKGKIKKEFAGRFDESVAFAVYHSHHTVARKLWERGAKVTQYLSDSLQLAIMRNQYEMAELCFEMGAKIRVKYHFTDCLKKADDRMVGLIEKNRESIVLSLIADKQKCVTEMIDKRKKRKK